MLSSGGSGRVVPMQGLDPGASSVIEGRVARTLPVLDAECADRHSLFRRRGVPNTEAQRLLAAADGPDEHAAVPIPGVPPRATPASIRQDKPPSPMVISWHRVHPPGS